MAESRWLGAHGLDSSAVVPTPVRPDQRGALPPARGCPVHGPTVVAAVAGAVCLAPKPSGTCGGKDADRFHRRVRSPVFVCGSTRTTSHLSRAAARDARSRTFAASWSRPSLWSSSLVCAATRRVLVAAVERRRRPDLNRRSLGYEPSGDGRTPLLRSAPSWCRPRCVRRPRIYSPGCSSRCPTLELQTNSKLLQALEFVGLEMVG